MANFAVNNSNKAGKVFFGNELKVVEPYGKLELASMPTFWTKNIQLVKGTTRSRGAKKDGKSGASASASGGSNNGGTNNG